VAITMDIVVAADEGRGIGVGGKLPWRLPGDMAHFRKLTSHTEKPGKRNAVIMGRKTWESIPPKFRPLPQRLNMVLSRSASLELPAGALHCGSLDAALADAAADSSIENVFVIGGGAVYAEALAHPACRRVYITRVLRTFECDTFLPAFEDRFREVSVMLTGRDDDIDYRVEIWTRNDAAQ
jgi:dihydrofolate reductase